MVITTWPLATVTFGAAALLRLEDSLHADPGIVKPIYRAVGGMPEFIPVPYRDHCELGHYLPEEIEIGAVFSAVVVNLVVMILMMGLCFLFMMYMMRRWKGNMTCCLPLFRKAEGTNYAAPDSARDIMDKRYASGEISAEEYEERKKNLNQTQDTKGGI